MKNLYDVTITFDPASYDGPVESVAVRGEFLFYESGLTGHTDQTGMVDCDKKYTPHEYREGLDNIGGLYCEEMQKNAQGLYQVNFRLPAGVYPYHFLINPRFGDPTTDPRFSWSNMTMADGSQKGLQNLEAALACGFPGPENHTMVDPQNPPVAPTVTGKQSNSELYVGTEEESFCLPIRDKSKAGTITYLSYNDIDGNTQTMAVYLPARFDKKKT